MTLGNTIVAGNTAATSGPDVFGTVASQGHNLIGKTDGSTGWVGSDLTGTSATPLDPLLAPLGDYGGPTQTMALLPGSPAIGAGDGRRRHHHRPAGASRLDFTIPDIGAYQDQPRALHRHHRRRPAPGLAGREHARHDLPHRFLRQRRLRAGGLGRGRGLPGLAGGDDRRDGQASLRRPLHGAGRAADHHGHGHRPPGQHLGSLGPSPGDLAGAHAVRSRVATRQPFIFSAASGDGIAIQDPDAGPLDPVWSLTLSVTAGR